MNEAEGGSTPLIRSDMVYDFIKQKYPEFTAKIETEGVKYRKVCPEEDDPSSALGRSWKSTYRVQTREEAQIKAAEQGSTIEWLENGDCRIVTKALPAVRTSSNGRKSFFNHIVSAYTGAEDSRNKTKQRVVFANDELLPEDVMMDLVAFME